MRPCRNLTWRAKGENGLRTVERDSELWRFLQSWVRRIEGPSAGRLKPGAEFERFIFLWMSVNAWAALAVPDITRNHQDAYLVHAMAADPGLSRLFGEALENETFRGWVKELMSLAPVFQVLWLRNNGIDSWDPATETRAAYVQRVMAKGPFHSSRDGGQDIPAFSPSCAKSHLDVGEAIPVDWPHTLSTIYQVRCNLFHGGKTYSSSRDSRFVELAFNILWRVWRRVLPFDWGARSWEKLLVRSGFRFNAATEALEFLQETEANRGFLSKLLDAVGFGPFFDGWRFRLPSEFLTEAEWSRAWEQLRGRAEAGLRGFERIELADMDFYIAGLIRWLNALGHKTTISCDGHGREAPIVGLAAGVDASAVSDLILGASESRILYRDGRLVPRAAGSARMVRREDLLELAERLHQRYAVAAGRSSASPD